MTINRIFISALCCCFTAFGHAQIGSYRNDFSIGVNGGYIMSNISFEPKVSQKMFGGPTAGISARYVCEKYFNTICAIYAEVNYANIGWKENILTANDAPVINPATKLAEQYSRAINYIQIPVFAHLGWGREKKGFQFFFQAGPQLGLYMNEKTKSNFEFTNMNVADRANTIVAQDTMAVENKFDYGIAAGLGVEYSMPKVGHFLIEGRYYYGLGNIYGSSKKDYFGRSNFSNIVIKLTYLFDLTRTKK